MSTRPCTRQTFPNGLPCSTNSARAVSPSRTGAPKTMFLSMLSSTGNESPKRPICNLFSLSLSRSLSPTSSPASPIPLQLVKSVGAETADNSIAAEATRRISELFHLDNQWDDLSKKERKKRRQLVLKPKVDDFFAWAKTEIQKLPVQSTTRNGLQYCINQEQFLRVFLSNGDVPMDNNLAEQAIRPFTIGRKNWVCANSIHGASASAILYSIVETAKANDLKVYDYLEFLLAELPKHVEDTGREFLKDLLPWSETIQEKCSNRKKS